MNLTLIESRKVNNALVDGFYGDKQSWFTRTQIGEALGYSDPQQAILLIHKRHKNRLDLFSRYYQFDTPSGLQAGYVYSFRGVLEICRWSKQPKADEVMDALYDMAESVREKGYFSLMPDMELCNMLANKYLENPLIAAKIGTPFIKNLAEFNIKEEKREAKEIIRDMNRQHKAILKYYSSHLGEDGYQDAIKRVTDNAVQELAEKCPHIEVPGMSIHCIQVKNK